MRMSVQRYNYYNTIRLYDHLITFILLFSILIMILILCYHTIYKFDDNRIYVIILYMVIKAI